MSLLGHLFTLPTDLFDQAVVASSSGQAHAADQDPAILDPLQDSPLQEQHATSASSANEGAAGQRGAVSSASCITCGIGVSSPGFDSPAEQRTHFRTDWHRLNVKRRVSGQSPVSEEEFEQIVANQDEVGSISGSEDCSSEEEEQDRGQRRQALGLRSSQVIFRNAGGKHFAVWRPLVLPDGQRQPVTDAHVEQQLAQLRASTGTWVVILSRGGHFVAAVFNVRPAQQQPQQPKAEPKLCEVVVHKTFHRYVVRAKAGGRQSAKDATGKYAKSAGSRLRRYNEAALEKEIQELLHSWQAHIDAADLLFVQAPSANATAVFGGASPPLSKTDPRLRSIPFFTRRPTFSEAQRVVRTLLCVYEPSAATLQALEQPPAKPAAKVRVAPSPQKPKDAPAGMSEPSVPADQPQDASSAREAELDGPLHRASRAGDAAKVKALLQGGMDPTAHDARGRTPYAVAADKGVRDMFRRFMAAEPDKWDYVAAGVPSPLTDELEAQQLAKQAEKKARLKAKEKERKAAAAQRKAAVAAEEVRTAAAEAAAITASQKSRVSAKAKAPVVSPSETEARKRREQLAAAAEARMAALKLAAQQQQLW